MNETTGLSCHGASMRSWNVSDSLETPKKEFQSLCTSMHKTQSPKNTKGMDREQEYQSVTELMWQTGWIY